VLSATTAPRRIVSDEPLNDWDAVNEWNQPSPMSSTARMEPIAVHIGRVRKSRAATRECQAVRVTDNDKHQCRARNTERKCLFLERTVHMDWPH